MLASLQLSGILEMATPISLKAMASKTKMAAAENDTAAATHRKWPEWTCESDRHSRHHLHFHYRNYRRHHHLQLFLLLPLGLHP